MMPQTQWRESLRLTITWLIYFLSAEVTMFLYLRWSFCGAPRWKHTRPKRRGNSQYSKANNPSLANFDCNVMHQTVTIKHNEEIRFHRTLIGQSGSRHYNRLLFCFISSKPHIHSKFTATTYRSCGLQGRKCQTAAPELEKEKKLEVLRWTALKCKRFFLYRFRFANANLRQLEGSCSSESKMAAVARSLALSSAFISSPQRGALSHSLTKRMNENMCLRQWMIVIQNFKRFQFVASKNVICYVQSTLYKC